MVKRTRERLPPFGKRAFRFTVQAKLINKYIESLCISLLNSLGVSYEEIKSILAEAQEKDEITNIFESNPVLKNCVEKSATVSYVAVSAMLLMVFENVDYSVRFAAQAYKLDPTDVNVLLVNALALIRYNR